MRLWSNVSYKQQMGGKTGSDLFPAIHLVKYQNMIALPTTTQGFQVTHPVQPSLCCGHFNIFNSRSLSLFMEYTTHCVLLGYNSVPENLS